MGHGSQREAQRRHKMHAHVVVRKRAAVLQLLARKDQTLLVRGDALLVLAEGSERRRDASVARPHISSLAQQRHSTPHHNAHLRLHVVNRVRRLHIKRDGLARQRLHKDLHATTQAQHQVQCALLLTVGQGADNPGWDTGGNAKLSAGTRCTHML